MLYFMGCQSSRDVKADGKSAVIKWPQQFRGVPKDWFRALVWSLHCFSNVTDSLNPSLALTLEIFERKQVLIDLVFPREK